MEIGTTTLGLCLHTAAIRHGKVEINPCQSCLCCVPTFALESRLVVRRTTSLIVKKKQKLEIRENL